jgi:hypothetical protein
MNAMVGGGLLKEAWGASVIGAYSYRGVFDVGLNLTRYAYTAGINKNLAGYSAMPYVDVHFLRSDETMPISFSVLAGIERIAYTGNGSVANPEGWSVLAGPTVYRRFEFGTHVVFSPQAIFTYQRQLTRFYSTAADQNSNNGYGIQGDGAGYSSVSTQTVGGLVRANVLYDRITIVPYAGFQGALVAGLDVGTLF